MYGGGYVLVPKSYLELTQEEKNNSVIIPVESSTELFKELDKAREKGPISSWTFLITYYKRMRIL